ncbi:MAG: caspase family protein [Bradyrhizobium sp.]
MHWKRLALVVFLIGIFSSPAFAGKRIALVIGNSAYRHVAPLPNRKDDAILMAGTLQRPGFRNGPSRDFRPGTALLAK